VLLVLAALVSAPAVADVPPAPPRTAQQRLPPERRPPSRLRRPNEARLNELAQQREFQYLEPTSRPEQSAWQAFRARVLQAIADWLNSRSYSHFWRWVFYALFLSVGVFVVLKLLQVELTTMLGRTPRRVALAYDTATENIHEVDFSARLAEAEAAGNLRLAVRLGYLQLLKTLSDRGLIQWQPDKTNHAYVAELLPTGQLREPFGEITRQFEYVWYGELALTRPLYEQVRTSQRAFDALAGGRTERHAA
jgi:hypothetical protein